MSFVLMRSSVRDSRFLLVEVLHAAVTGRSSIKPDAVHHNLGIARYLLRIQIRHKTSGSMTTIDAERRECAPTRTACQTMR